jgi:hypothetical protein
MRLSIGYLCPFPIPIEILKELEGEYFADENELLIAGMEMVEDPGYIVGGLSWRDETVDRYLKDLDNQQRFHLGLACMMTAGDRLLSMADNVDDVPSIRPELVAVPNLQRETAKPTEPDLAALPD